MVQDDYYMARDWADLLQKDGIAAVVKADTVQEALWCIRNYKPQVVILDIQIPLTPRDTHSREFKLNSSRKRWIRYVASGLY
jgi:DNA-binding response OmpR family regulator